MFYNDLSICANKYTTVLVASISFTLFILILKVVSLYHYEIKFIFRLIHYPFSWMPAIIYQATLPVYLLYITHKFHINI